MREEEEEYQKQKRAAYGKAWRAAHPKYGAAWRAEHPHYRENWYMETLTEEAKQDYLLKKYQRKAAQESCPTSHKAWRRKYPHHLAYNKAWKAAYPYPLTQEEWRQAYPTHLTYIAAWNEAHEVSRSIRTRDSCLGIRIVTEAQRHRRREASRYIVMSEEEKQKRREYARIWRVANPRIKPPPTEAQLQRQQRRERPPEQKRAEEQAKRMHAIKNDPRYHLRVLARGACRRAKEKALPFDRDWLYQLVDTPPKRCTYCARSFQYPIQDRWDTPTLDRVDNANGYVKGNVAIVCWKCNTFKNAGTAAELERIVQGIRRHQRERDQAA